MIIAYGINFFYDRAAKSKEKASKNDPIQKNESVDYQFDQIRRQISNKKSERAKEKKIYNSTKANKRNHNIPPVVTVFKDSKEPSDFQIIMDKQALHIKQKQKEAEQLNSKLQSLNIKPTNTISQGSEKSRKSAAKTRKRIRAVLSNKRETRSVFLLGEIIAKPISLRTNEERVL